jgi:choline dehydrogenase-like flavoprotein
VKILIIGSGPTGVHFALSVLRKNHQVTMIDVGTVRPAMALPDENFTGLKQSLDDPVRYFLGERFDAAILPEPSTDSKFYTLPPSKKYVFEAPQCFDFAAYGLSPLISFAAGGLAEAWTGGCYPLNDAELSAFPFSYDDIEPYYGEVARRIGIAGAEDDLGRFYPRHDLLPPPSLDENSARLLARYEGRRATLISKHKIIMGRSRHSVLTEGRDGRGGCRYCGRCLWGCPNEAFYTPSLTLRDCVAHANFTYRAGFFASHFHLAPDSSITHLVAYAVKGRGREAFCADAYVLACGTISTSNIVLRSVYKSTGEIIRLNGLTDNRQVLAPFLNLTMLGRSYDPHSYQYHQLAIGMLSADATQYIHGQITTLKAATVHPLIKSLPVDFKTAISLFSDFRSGLGVLTLFFSDCRREDNYLTLEQPSAGSAGDTWPKLSIHYTPPEDDPARIKRTLARLRRFFYDLRAPILPGLTRISPVGSGVHYSGTLPLSREKKSWCLSENCQSYDIPNLFIVDGAAMPFLPAKNLTFTLMANAVRVAERAF